jgi:H+/Cl- antiporter ClcA
MVIGHYALKAFAPIVIASVAGTAVSRTWFGDFPAFSVDVGAIVSFWEMPAFALLGIVCGVGAVVFMRAIGLSARVAARVPVPGWLKPAIAGLILGIAATYLPHILGVGYSATESAMLGSFTLLMLIGIGLAKTAATALWCACTTRSTARPRPARPAWDQLPMRSQPWRSADLTETRSTEMSEASWRMMSSGTSTPAPPRAWIAR